MPSDLEIEVLRLRAQVIGLRVALRDALNLERWWRERSLYGPSASMREHRPHPHTGSMLARDQRRAKEKPP